MKKFLLLCLICLQLIAPYIHAHAFGVESTHANHAHSVKEIFHSHDLGSDLKLHIVEFNSQEIIETPEAIGSIFNVASGIKRSIDFDTNVFIISCLLVFVSLSRIGKRFARASNPSFYQPQPYSPHSPRAPPR